MFDFFGGNAQERKQRKDPEYWHQQAQNEHFITRDNKKALQYINKAIKLDAKQKTYWFLKGHILRELGQHDDAVECEKTGERLPGNAF